MALDRWYWCWYWWYFVIRYARRTSLPSSVSISSTFFWTRRTLLFPALEPRPLASTAAISSSSSRIARKAMCSHDAIVLSPPPRSPTFNRPTQKALARGLTHASYYPVRVAVCQPGILPHRGERRQEARYGSAANKQHGASRSTVFRVLVAFFPAPPDVLLEREY